MVKPKEQARTAENSNTGNHDSDFVFHKENIKAEVISPQVLDFYILRFCRQNACHGSWPQHFLLRCGNKAHFLLHSFFFVFMFPSRLALGQRVSTDLSDLFLADLKVYIGLT